MIELLVVIGIIGILTAFLVVNLSGARDRAKEAGVKMVMHNLQLAVEAYNMENETYPPVKETAVETLCTNYLLSGGYIAAIPKNPFTGLPYKDGDASGKVIYQFDATAVNYTITGYGRSGLKKIQELTAL
jgi:type II secretory pathway pseudopilin PulG